jgi:hypothetical protein
MASRSLAAVNDRVTAEAWPSHISQRRDIPSLVSNSELATSDCTLSARSPSAKLPIQVREEKRQYERGNQGHQRRE